MSEHEHDDHDGQDAPSGSEPAPEPTPEPKAKAKPRARAAGRDAHAARSAAAERVAEAQRIADAVEAYHSAADRIDAATAELNNASQDRLEAIKTLRGCRLTIAEIGELTGLSSSRVQALAR